MTNSVVIVTGASQGIGRSTAMRLARDFKSVVLVARNRAKLEETAAAVSSVYATPLIIDLDLSERSSAKGVVERALSTFGRIDALVNIARRGTAN
jgi:3-oxoacyl-[acyl-carrier protein] reductase